MAEMSVVEAARAAEVSRDTVVRAMKSGAITATGKGTKADPYRITTEALAQWRRDTRVDADRIERQIPAGSAITRPTLLSLPEVSESSGLPLHWLKRQCRARTVAHYRFGVRSIRMDADQIRAAIARHQVGGDADLAAERAFQASRPGRRRTTKAA